MRLKREGLRYANLVAAHANNTPPDTLGAPDAGVILSHDFFGVKLITHQHTRPLVRNKYFWKFHIPVHSEDVGKAWDAIIDYLIDQGVGYAKVASPGTAESFSKPNRHIGEPGEQSYMKQEGKMITLYVLDQPDLETPPALDWASILTGVEERLVDAGVRAYISKRQEWEANKFTVFGDRRIPGSFYGISYRCDKGERGEYERPSDYIRRARARRAANPNAIIGERQPYNLCDAQDFFEAINLRHTNNLKAKASDFLTDADAQAPAMTAEAGISAHRPPGTENAARIRLEYLRFKKRFNQDLSNGMAFIQDTLPALERILKHPWRFVPPAYPVAACIDAGGDSQKAAQQEAEAIREDLATLGIDSGQESITTLPTGACRLLLYEPHAIQSLQILLGHEVLPPPHLEESRANAPSGMGKS